MVNRLITFQLKLKAGLISSAFLFLNKNQSNPRIPISAIYHRNLKPQIFTDITTPDRQS
jgi:hypothetical protein